MSLKAVLWLGRGRWGGPVGLGCGAARFHSSLSLSLIRSLSLEATGHYVTFHWSFSLLYMFTTTYDWLLVSLLSLADKMIDATASDRPNTQAEYPDVDWLMGYEGNSSKSYISPESGSGILLRP